MVVRVDSLIKTIKFNADYVFLSAMSLPSYPYESPKKHFLFVHVYIFLLTNY